MTAAVHVQIVTTSQQRRRLWSDALVAAGIATMQPPHGSHEGQLDVVLTDLPLGLDGDDLRTADWHNGIVQVASTASGALTGTEENRLEVAVEGPPRVVLPSDATAREIALACLLLAPVVRLRRVQRDADEREARWKQLADADPLTGLMNRRAFTERLVAFLRVAAGAQNCCLALLDLDHFKPVNDQVGHSAGDAVLRHVAERLSSAVRKGDLVCRLGGDEFAVALFGAPLEIAGKLVERLRQAVAAKVSEGARDISASAGWAMLSTATVDNKTTTTATELLSDSQVDAHYHQAFEAADANLRAAKSLGRDRTIPS